MKKVIWGMLCLAMTSCTKGTLLHRYQTVDEEGWERTDTLLFEIPEIQEYGEYSLSMGIRYDNSFPYEGLWIEVDTRLQYPRGHHCDTLYLRTNDENGMPLGNGIGLMQRDTTLWEMTLPKGQNGHIAIRHLMSREVMKGVREIGIKIEQRRKY